MVSPTQHDIARLEAGELTRQLKAEAVRLGFPLAGVCPAVEPTGLSRFHEWLEAGYAGTMRYLPDRREAYAHPRSVLEGVRSLVLLALPYRTRHPQPNGAGQGKVSRYAWGERDYHDVIHERLEALKDWLVTQRPGARVRGVVDTAPLLEREFAQLAGLGWIGKNTLLLNKYLGSWFFLAALLTDETLDYDLPHTAQHCGTCRACLDACPTGAFPQPYVLDATRCISYLTIELREPIPLELRPHLDDWVFGCDVCQDVCPWNRKGSATDEASFQPQETSDPMNLLELFDMTDEQFRQRFRRTPLWRPRRRGLLRNAAIVLGNQCRPESIPALVRGLNDPEPLVRGACAWALGRFRDPRAREALQTRLAIEADEMVQTEIGFASAEQEFDAGQAT